jgi:polysaccharide deacetylase family protein (PEP-CTERM system associated)
MNEPRTSRSTSKSHILTIGLDDYYQAAALKNSIPRDQWYRFESRLEKNAIRTLDLLDESDTKATFFVTGYVAEKKPDIVREVVRRGHEIASQGYCLKNVRQMSPAEFREDLRRAQSALQEVIGVRIVGNRCARPLVSPNDLWALDVLAEEGYVYDSSLLPVFRSFRRQPWRRFVHSHEFDGRQLIEFPFSTWDCFGFLLPIAGGVYLRQIPYDFHKRSVESWNRMYEAPFVMYFHVWELDAEQPRINVASALEQIRHYRNLGKTGPVIRRYLKQYRFGPISDHLQIDKSPGPSAQKAEENARAPREQRHPIAFCSTSLPATPQEPTPVTLVVPFFNEEAALGYFSKALEKVELELSGTYALRFVFVDDGSSDHTWEMLHAQFGMRSDCLLLRHPSNLGVAAAIRSGIKHSSTEIVCSIDSDCTYDPSQLKKLIPELVAGVDLVTGSPYHPQGSVVNVPRWRLALSKSASFLYRQILRQKLYTYTACFRVYRRSVVNLISVEEGGFLGIPEMIGKLDLGGYKMCEVPATLEVRLLGRSKMKLLPLIFGHLALMARLLRMRLFSSTLQSRQTTESEKQTPVERAPTRPAA